MSEWLRELTREEVIAIHDASLARFGGLAGIRDEGLLQSALAQPFMSFDGQDLYPTISEKSARLAFGLARNHPFLDGNKRVAAACLGAFLRLNGHVFKPEADELLAIFLGVAAGTISVEDLSEWVARQL